MSELIKVLDHGHVRLVDHMGERYARERKLACVQYFADWGLLGKKAGYVRNARMASNADKLIAFWDGRSKGTRHMISIMQSMALPVVVVYAEGAH